MWLSGLVVVLPTWPELWSFGAGILLIQIFPFLLLFLLSSMEQKEEKGGARSLPMSQDKEKERLKEAVALMATQSCCKHLCLRVLKGQEEN